MRIAAKVEYDGSAFCGWQWQDHCLSVQQVVETALSKVANAPIRVVCAGRTDAGVHGLGQIVHFDTQATRDMRGWVFGANANMPDTVALLWAMVVPETFHARFSAVRRIYQYQILNRQIRPALLHKRVAWEYRPLAIDRMQAAATFLIGEHDFTSYRAQACQAKNPVRTLYRLDIRRRDDMVILELEANAFLHHMVRNIAGVLSTIGAGEQEPIWAKQILELRDRTQAGMTASPHGLYFMQAIYPEEFALPVMQQT